MDSPSRDAEVPGVPSRYRAPRGRDRTSVAVAISLIVGLVLGGGGWLVYRSGACDPHPLTVTAAPGVTPAVSAVAARLNRKGCARVEVVSAESEDMAGLPSGEDTGPAPHARPDVWIADSSLWLDVLNGRGAAPRQAPSIASSPLVFAVAPKNAKRAASRLRTRSWAAFRGGKTYGPMLLDPAETATGMASLLALWGAAGGEKGTRAFTDMLQGEQTVSSVQQAVGGLTRRDRTPVLIASEQALRRQGGRLTTITPATATPALDYPYVVTTTVAARRRTAADLLAALRAPSGVSEIRKAGLRPPPAGDAGASSAPPVMPVAQPGAARNIRLVWRRITTVVRVLTLVDTSASMRSRMPGTRLTRMEATKRALTEGISAMPAASEFGLWEFPVGGRGRPYRSLVSLGRLDAVSGDEPHASRLQERLGRLREGGDEEGGLYDSVLAAYRAVEKNYDPDKLNIVLVLTDGHGDTRSRISASRLTARLKKSFNPKRPVSVIGMGFGDDADMNALSKIANATDGGAYKIEKQGQIMSLFMCAPALRVRDDPNCPR